MTKPQKIERGKKYTEELEKALIFLCECYVSARDSIACRELNGQTDEKYADLWMKFPMVQGSQNIFAIENISSLRTKLGNREANTMSLQQIFEKMHEGRYSEHDRQAQREEWHKKQLNTKPL